MGGMGCANTQGTSVILSPDHRLIVGQQSHWISQALSLCLVVMETF